MVRSNLMKPKDKAIFHHGGTENTVKGTNLTMKDTEYHEGMGEHTDELLVIYYPSRDLRIVLPVLRASVVKMALWYS